MSAGELDHIRHLLPARVAEIADVAGLAAAMTLVKLRGGRRLYVPKHPAANHWLVDHIGMDALTKLSAHYQGIDIEIDLCKALQRAIIVAEYERGVPISRLAETYGCTERNIRYMVNASIGKHRPVKPMHNTDWIEEYIK